MDRTERDAIRSRGGNRNDLLRSLDALDRADREIELRNGALNDMKNLRDNTLAMIKDERDNARVENERLKAEVERLRTWLTRVGYSDRCLYVKKCAECALAGGPAPEEKT